MRLEVGDKATIRTSVAVEIPDGFVGLVCPRSGLAFRDGITVLNGPGVIDSNFRGEVQVALYKAAGSPSYIHHGDRIAQLVVVPVCPWPVLEVDELSRNEVRGDAGFGSSGR